MYASFSPKGTALATFCTIFAIKIKNLKEGNKFSQREEGDKILEEKEEREKRKEKKKANLLTFGVGGLVLRPGSDSGVVNAGHMNRRKKKPLIAFTIP